MYVYSQLHVHWGLKTNLYVRSCAHYEGLGFMKGEKQCVSMNKLMIKNIRNNCFGAKGVTYLL